MGAVCRQQLYSWMLFGFHKFCVSMQQAGSCRQQRIIHVNFTVCMFLFPIMTVKQGMEMSCCRSYRDQLKECSLQMPHIFFFIQMICVSQDSRASVSELTSAQPTETVIVLLWPTTLRLMTTWMCGGRKRETLLLIKRREIEEAKQVFTTNQYVYFNNGSNDCVCSKGWGL